MWKEEQTFQYQLHLQKCKPFHSRLFKNFHCQIAMYQTIKLKGHRRNKDYSLELRIEKKKLQTIDGTC